VVLEGTNKFNVPPQLKVIAVTTRAISRNCDMAPSGVIHVPLPVPTHPNVPPPRELTEQEQAEYDSVFAHFVNPEYVLPDAALGKGPLMEEERMWLVRACSFLARMTTRLTRVDVAVV
jgi:hypothetical protein